MADFDAPKKRPGRPRKNPYIPIGEIKGISNEPNFPTNVVELMHHIPSIFQKFFNTFNTYLAIEIKIMFVKAGMLLIARDHLEKSTIICSVDGSKAAHYYCGEELSFGINANDHKKLKSLKKNCTRINFTIPETTKDSIMHLFIHDPFLDMDQRTVINMITVANSELLMPLSYDDYPIKFEIPMDVFKGIISNIRGVKNCSSFSIEKIRDEPLCIKYGIPGKLAECITFECDERIDLQSTLTENDIFSITITVAYIKHFASTVLGETVKIAVDRFKDIMLESEIARGAGCVRVFTKIDKIVP